MKIDRNHLASQMMSREWLQQMIDFYVSNYNEKTKPNFFVYAGLYQMRLRDLINQNYKCYYISKNAFEKQKTIDFKKFFDSENWIDSFNRHYSGILITEKYTCLYTISNNVHSSLSFNVLSNDTSNGIFTFSTLIIPKECTYNVLDEETNALHRSKTFPLDLLPDDQKVVLEGFLRMLFFIEFAEVKTIEVSPKNLKYGCKGHWQNELFNDTDKKITVVDIGWDVTIKTGAFTVQGHLRWQRHGENYSKRKLIWIDEFEKDGYTREAGKLKEN